MDLTLRDLIHNLNQLKISTSRIPADFSRHYLKAFPNTALFKSSEISDRLISKFKSIKPNGIVSSYITPSGEVSFLIDGVPVSKEQIDK